MSRRRRRQEADDRARRFQELPPERARLIMSVLISNAFVSAALQIALLARCVSAARRVVRARHATRSTAHAALTPPVVALACATGLHLVLTKVVLPRWVDRAVLGAECTRPRRDQPPSG